MTTPQSPSGPKSAPPTAAASVPTKTGRGVKTVLAVSLALNLGVAGVVAGAALRAHGDDGAMRRNVREVNFGPFTEALSRDQRRDMLRRLGGDGPGLRAMRAQMREDMDEVISALRAKPFDPAAARAAFDRQGARLAMRADAGRKALVDLVLAMSEAERADFVTRLDEAARTPRHRPRGRE